ncbi:MAG: hypothetical protein V3V56_01865, partial [bacterium]
FILPPLEGPVGKKHTPVVQAIAAQTEIRDGAFWKIYVSASDPDGDLDKIMVTFGQLGAAMFTPDILYQEKKSQSLNGSILVWADLNGGGATDTIYGTVEITVIDSAGNESAPKTMEFEVQQLGPNDSFVPPPIFDASNHLGQAEFPLLTDEGLVGDSLDG